MPVDTSGHVTRPVSPIPVSGQDADAPQVNVPIDDIYAALNLLMFLDGRKSLTGNIPMNGKRAVNAADAQDAQDYVTLAQMQAFLGGISQIPTGFMGPLTGSTVPSGWVRANGQSLSRATYPDLWAFAQASGNLAATEGAKTAGQYGPGNGSTTFTIPNLEASGGYFIRPITSGRGIGTIQADDFKSHNHSGSTSSDGAHTHGVLVGAYNVDGTLRAARGSSTTETRTNEATVSAGAHSHTLTINSSGGTETRPKNIAYPYIIKT